MPSTTSLRPVHVKYYLGSSFITQHNTYKISKKGKFKGRPSIEGAQVDHIGGLEEKYYEAALDCLDITRPELREQLDQLIKEYGQKIRPGLIIVASLTPEDVKKKNRHGIVTSPVKDISYIN
ncbi:hypothetical protein AYK26_02845 [Euryarchaeota archaeon SM23-78]|nr:MAG: hypothetical protein AYK26_02845 [Euryarchaeota archaeon SM23-78]